MPRHAVAEDLKSGRLVELRLPEAPPLQYGLHALWRRDARPGPASSWMLEALTLRCGSAQPSGPA
jgi:DNA-binding transcriptional LysR family regulator